MPCSVNDYLQIECLFTIALIFYVTYLMLKNVSKNWKFVSNLVRLVNALLGDVKNPGIGVRMERQSKESDKQAEILERV